MKLRITVEGKSYDVEVEMLDDLSAARSAVVAPVAPAPHAAPAHAAPPPRPAPAPAPAAAPAAPSAGGGGAVKAPIVGTVLSVKVNVGDVVEVNQVVAVMEAMKMETNVASPVAGRVKSVGVKAGEPVKAGQLLIELE